MEIKARAPGKVILAGEHAVVHGSTAVAASIENDDTLKLTLKDLGLEFSWSVGRIRETLSHLGGPFPLTPTSCSRETIRSISVLVEEQSFPEARIELATGVFAFIWLYTSIQGFKPATVVVISDLPVGAGLGSSAAFCVSLIATLLAHSDCVSLDKNQQGWLSYGDSDLDLLNKWAFEGEKIIHGKPSGLDNTVSTYGNIIKFRSGNLTPIKSNTPLKMLITNTKVGRNTKALVGGVSERTFRHPYAMSSVFNAVDSISKELSTLIESPAPDVLSVTEKEEKLQELMEMNQGLLQCMGVSHAVIETVLRTTLKYRLPSKLTGAGGGGCVLTLLPALLSRTIVDKVKTELESCGFQCWVAGIGGNGVEVCFGESS
ncbi:mevalonate kinase-like isoform X2 [Mangifera indica]|uniref:mevalonate kinase-like isoform X2 n=1 Tax=Mangifera indica TaxID=29780 RepID=UPI001CF942A7|nr:mevalonate kinase-like isoform X2 [Mangifera indica]